MVPRCYFVANSIMIVLNERNFVYSQSQIQVTTVSVIVRVRVEFSETLKGVFGGSGGQGRILGRRALNEIGLLLCVWLGNGEVHLMVFKKRRLQLKGGNSLTSGSWCPLQLIP